MGGLLELEFVLQVLASAFFAILFLQSGIDKVVDHTNNLDWLKGHFKATPLAGFVPFMLLTLTILEVAAGIVSAIGLAVLLAGGTSDISYYGVILSGCCFIALFFGQRIAKDYAGAAALAPYFTVALLSIFICAPGTFKTKLA